MFSGKGAGGPARGEPGRHRARPDATERQV